jgi:hypothetical protein
LGKGKISLKGSKKRPWLELRRTELEKTYLDHQLRRLRKVHDGPIEADWDILPTNGFYDDHRVRLHCEELYHVYELLYPRDERTITPEILEIAGSEGLAALFTDRASLGVSTIQLGTFPNSREVLVIERWLRGLGYPPFTTTRSTARRFVYLSGEAAQRLKRNVWPLLHPVIRAKFKARPR